MKRDVISQGLIVLAITLSAMIASTTAAYPKTSGSSDMARGREIASGKCAICHGAQGNSTNPAFPKLAGQRATYLYGQLRAFKAGGRRSKIMSTIATGLTDTEMTDTANFYSHQKLRPDRVGNEASTVAGRRIFYHGANSGATPACEMCHSTSGAKSMMGGGMMGGGMMGSIPKLNGQHAAYLIRQLRDFASGRRQGMMMNSIAGSLTQTEMHEVAGYLSGIP